MHIHQNTEVTEVDNNANVFKTEWGTEMKNKTSGM